MKEYCMSCIHYQPAGNVTGYCTFLAVMIEKGVAIVDTHMMIQMVKSFSSEQKVYDFVVVENTFGCVCYKRITVQ